MVRDRCNYFSFWAIFCPFTSVCYTVPEIWCVKDVIVIIHFGLFFALLPPPPPNSLKNQNFKKMKKKPGDIIILQMCTKNYD